MLKMRLPTNFRHVFGVIEVFRHAARFSDTLLVSLIFLFSAASICQAYNAADPVSNYTGLNVMEISREGYLMAEEEFRALIPFREGDILHMSLVRNGIMNLFRTGLFDGVEVHGRPLDGGVAVLFRVTPKRWLNEVRFMGNFRLSDGDLSKKVDLGREEELTSEDLERNRGKLLDYYRHRGFLEPGISYSTETAPRRRTDVVFRIEEGLRWLISDARVSGDPGMSRVKLMAVITSMPGTVLDGDALDRDVVRITDYLKKKSYYYPKVSYTVEPDSRFRGDAVVEFQVTKGVRYHPGIEITPGSEKTGRFLKWIRKAFISEPEPGAAMEKSGAKVREYFLRRGYPFVSVEWQDRQTPSGIREVILRIDRGDLATIGSVTIDGVRSLQRAGVEEAFGLRKGDSFVHTSLEEGLRNLGGAYESEGYLAAKVTQKPLEFVQGDQHQEVTIHVVVEEGIQTRIGEVSVEGEVDDEEELLAILNVHPDDPYVVRRVGEGRLALLEKMSREGHLYAAVPYPQILEIDSGMVDLVYDIKAGPKVHLGSIIIQGAEEVHIRIIRKALDMRRGDLLTIKGILEAQRRVYNLGVHSSVEISLVDQRIPATDKDIIVKVRERPRYALGIRLGYGSEDKARIRFTATDRNVAGMARSLILSLRLSDIEELASLTYLHPWFLGEPVEFSASLIDLHEERDSYTRDEIAVVLSVKREVSRRSTFRLQYVLEALDLSDVSPDAQLSPEDVGRTDVASVIPEFLYDSRDDFFDPTSGILGDVRLEVAMEELGSKAEFYKFEISARKYMAVGKKTVLAILVRMGIAESYGISDEVIISKRFLLGGQNSVRGYALDELGPIDAQGDPIGGDRMLNFNLELRYPVYRSIKGVIFADSGALGLDVEPFDDSTLRVAGGAGLRWSSPIGPLSLDYGYKVNPATDDEDRWRVHFSIGHAF